MQLIASGGLKRRGAAKPACACLAVLEADAAGGGNAASESRKF